MGYRLKMSAEIYEWLAELRDSDDEPRAMSDLWRDRPALVLWVRHFG